MSNGIYLGNSNSKKVKKLYIGTNNQAKRIKKGYIGVNNQAKLFWTHTIYRWNRYQIEQEVVDVVPSVTVIDTGDPSYSTYSTSRGIQVTDGVMHLINPTAYVHSAGSDNDGYNLFAESWLYVPDPKNNVNRYFYHIIGTGGVSVWIDSIPYLHSYGIFIQARTSNHSPFMQCELQSVAGTLVDVVESDNPSAYPDNGVSGNYWYKRIS